MKRLLACVICVLVFGSSARPQSGDQGLPPDSRLGKPKDLSGYFPWTPPTDLKSWQTRRQQLREQVLVANGLWPMPEKTPLQPVIHSPIVRDGYTIEKVFFASVPGHYVTGNLYRPTGKTGKLPAILSPHGHWGGNRSNPPSLGRLYEAGQKEAEKQIASGAEKTIDGARYPLQARCAQLARLGCIVFHYDMVGYADSTQIHHPGSKQNPTGGFADPEGELRLQSFMGLQTLNSVRALDFLLSLADVDPKRIGVTGASGGGTQTFVLCAIDDRPAAAFPAVMVSTGMQGGCICENCSYLRVGTGNIELAGLFAPKPLGMSAAKDWTWELESKGLPELKALYRMFDREDHVTAKAFLEFGHNYNQVAREMMYNFFNKHLKLGHAEPIVEQPFVPVPPKELSVFDAEHPLPKDAVGIHGLRNYLSRSSDTRIAALMPKDGKSLGEFRRVIGTALRVMVNDTLPSSEDVAVVGKMVPEQKDGVTLHKAHLTRKDQGEAIPTVGVMDKNFSGTVVVWIHPRGMSSLWQDGKLIPAAREIINKKGAILAADIFMTGAFASAKSPPIHKNYAGYTFGYNRSLLANRVHDILTLIAWAKKVGKKVHVMGFGEAGPWVVLARGLAGDAVERTAVDLNQFRFENIVRMDDEMMLPGAIKYGGLAALTALCAPHDLLLHNAAGTATDPWVAAYRVGRQGRIEQHPRWLPPEQVLAWLLR